MFQTTTNHAYNSRIKTIPSLIRLLLKLLFQINRQADRSLLALHVLTPLFANVEINHPQSSPISLQVLEASQRMGDFFPIPILISTVETRLFFLKVLSANSAPQAATSLCCSSNFTSFLSNNVLLLSILYNHFLLLSINIFNFFIY